MIIIITSKVPKIKKNKFLSKLISSIISKLDSLIMSFNNIKALMGRSYACRKKIK